MPNKQRATIEAVKTLQAVVIEMTGVYTVPQVREMLGLRQSSLRREIREGRLSVNKRCGKYFFLGEQLLEWLRAGQLPRRKQAD